ncbi:MAG: bifunctional phosphoribosylaminoimidazolecarboxamide formyltransferase/IMP cyclohydrolase, partial [Acidobacteria bacterium]|nr:bifunctional phosphoribosylaminoimidazolecarboxamide formyltransferase/IMP cyclohydrolase [Acidobacteriota bacterium]
ILEEIESSGSGLSLETRWRLCRKAFDHTACYDTLIADALGDRLALGESGEELELRPPSIMPPRLGCTLRKRQELRYGENPHQPAALYRFDGDAPGVAQAEQLHGKELSFNNYLDLDAAWNLVTEFEAPACVIIKHTNPCGAALGEGIGEAYLRALAADPVSAFGGIIAANRPIDRAAAEKMSQLFVEAVIAPEFIPDALEALAKKKNVRLMKVHGGDLKADQGGFDVKRITGGLLLQTRDRGADDASSWKVVTRRSPTPEETEALRFAWIVCKHVKSNAIVYARAGQLVGVGAGQMSRVDSVRLGAQRAVLPLTGTVAASDAFFPFRDGLDEAAKAGATAIVQPGGSVRDSEVIQAADEHDLAMVFTHLRHFRH